MIRRILPLLLLALAAAPGTARAKPKETTLQPASAWVVDWGEKSCVLGRQFDRTGRPTRCDTAQTFANTDFKVRACGIILQSARFNPALDKNGKPVDSYYATAIVYNL